MSVECSTCWTFLHFLLKSKRGEISGTKFTASVQKKIKMQKEQRVLTAHAQKKIKTSFPCRKTSKENMQTFCTLSLFSLPLYHNYLSVVRMKAPAPKNVCIILFCHIKKRSFFPTILCVLIQRIVHIYIYFFLSNLMQLIFFGEFSEHPFFLLTGSCFLFQVWVNTVSIIFLFLLLLTGSWSKSIPWSDSDTSSWCCARGRQRRDSGVADTRGHS